MHNARIGRLGRVFGLVPLMLTMNFLTTCARPLAPQDPQVAFDHAVATFQRGDTVATAVEVERGYKNFHAISPEWAWKFTILKAKNLSRQGHDDNVLSLLASEPQPPTTGDLAVQRLRLEGFTYGSKHEYPEAEKKFQAAERLCAVTNFPNCGDIARARGLVEMEHKNYPEAQKLLEQALSAAEATHDAFLQATAYLNLSFCADDQNHLDEALDWAQQASQIALEKDFEGVAQGALGNKAWAYYKLGDPQKAVGLFAEAEKQAMRLGNTTDRLSWLTASGYVYMDGGNFKVAEKIFQQSLELAKQIPSQEDVINALIALAFVYEHAPELGDAKKYADEALRNAQKNGNGIDIVYSELAEGLAAVQQHDPTAAKDNFNKVAQDKNTPTFLKWEAERSLARLYEDESQPGLAEREYQTALSTFETARCGLHDRVEIRLAFLSNAAHIYEDYVHFLISHNRADDALQAADYARARTLTEGLRRPCNAAFAPDRLNAPEIARRANGTILFYMLGEKNSYLWVITPRQARTFPIAVTKLEIDAEVQAYREKLGGAPEALENSEDGDRLYQKLIEPAQEFLNPELAKNNNIFIIPDGGLNGLNFETLRPQPKRYWIEDVTITNAASLHLLSAARGEGKNLAGKLLLMGDPVPPLSGPSEPYSQLPNTTAQMKNVEKYFPAERKTVQTREQATPAAYLNGHPERFSYIHFAAHGTANLLNPLDSAIILSRESSSKAAGKQDESYKLYARDIIEHPLTADLVTISACNSTGTRTFSGEGLVGLSWAFLRAGAHNVIGALWAVSDEPTPKLFDDFYGEMKKGKSPSYALRAAKLAMLHSGSVLRAPYNWAPFQLYTGS